MSKIKSYFIFVIAALLISPWTVIAQVAVNQAKNKKDEKQSKQILTVAPQEINLGTLTAEKSVEGTFALKNAGAKVVDWSTDGPEGWKKMDNKKLSGALKNKPESIHLTVKLLSKEAGDKQKNKTVMVEMKLETENEKIICYREFPAGTHNETIKVNSSDGQKTVPVIFSIAYTQKAPDVSLNPLRLDLGGVLPGKIVSKKIMLSNNGREMLTWSAALRKHQKEDLPDESQVGRYVSFVNDEARGSGVYTVPAGLKEAIEISGKWTEDNGYPTGADGENFIKINFIGTALIVCLSNYQGEEINMAISVDKNPVENIELPDDLEETKGEVTLVENLGDGPHVITIISKNSRLVFEGMKIPGGTAAFLPEGSIKILPRSGAVTRQTNYLTVSLNTAQMAPGYYLDEIVFNTNNGEGVIEVFAEVIADNISKVVDIYRYYNGTDYLFTADPQAETRRLIQNSYIKEGIAFRLFKPDTPGTSGFHRWYNPQTRSHFYHYDTAGGGKDLRGYIYEGVIGNIATSRLTNTRELYRWYNVKTGHYFYSTDMQGGKTSKKEFRFDGIAGYVR